MNTQEKPLLIVSLQGILMLGIALAPALTGFRFFFPRDICDWLGTTAILIGTAIVITSMRALKKTFTIKASLKSGTTLASTFPFNLSRNPMYVGGLIQCFAWSLLQRSLLSAILAALLLILLNIKVRFEERNLELVFGDEYHRYKEKVPRFF